MSSDHSRPQLLIVEEDVYLARFLERLLGAEQYLATVVNDVHQGMQLLASQYFDLTIVDVDNGGGNGLEALQGVRAQRRGMPVIVLASRGRSEDRVLSLDAGADDFLMKPFSPVEFAARVRALLRRNTAEVENVSQVADLTLIRDEWKVERGGKRVPLTATEFKLLEYLIRHAGRPVNRVELMENVWKQTYDPRSNLVDVYVKYVRDKVDAGAEKKLIQTIRGLGYVLSAEECSAAKAREMCRAE